MKVVIVGCGRLGAELAKRCYQHGHEVSVIDDDGSSFSKLPADFEGRISQGDAIDQDVLHRAGIERADAVAVVTDSDVMNAVVGHLVRSYYNITNVVVRNQDPRYRHILEAFNLQTIAAMSWGAQRIEEMLYHGEMRAVFSAGNGEVEIYELAIPEKWNDRRISDLMAAAPCIPVSLTRAGRAMLPTGDTRVQSGDIIHISATMEGIEVLRQCLITG